MIKSLLSNSCYLLKEFILWLYIDAVLHQWMQTVRFTEPIQNGKISLL
ncbi:hypothetical protein CPTT1_054 [Escherichia phage T1]|uniref:Uncharacterized protein n=2 Tax=Escherichia phage T1 TaxID=2492962 RepID=A0A3S9W0Y0_BPT1|nr:hypothetical protein ST25 [Escherichia phage T1]AAP49974.1 hypothetical protein CPTT1_054 [Escherichia phage T1]AZS32459.1 hypothetical protein [Escherichia phage T1]